MIIRILLAVHVNWFLSSFSVPTFIGFLKEIESPQEVKDYVKLYIGEGKQANNFANQYLEKRQDCNEPDYLSSTNSAMKQSKSKSTSDVPKKTTEFVEVKVRKLTSLCSLRRFTLGLTMFPTQISAGLGFMGGFLLVNFKNWNMYIKWYVLAFILVN